MKSCLLRSLVFAAILTVSAAAAAPFRPFILDLKPSSSPETVEKVLGRPSAMMGRDLWVYWNFSGPNPNAENPEYDTLVIGFTNGQVTHLKITDGRVVRQLLAQYKAQTAAASVAAK